MNTDLPEGSCPGSHEFARWLGTFIFVPFYRLRVHGRENVPGHGPGADDRQPQHHGRRPGAVRVLPRRPVFLIKEEMFKGPLGLLLPRIGQIAITAASPTGRR